MKDRVFLSIMSFVAVMTLALSVLLLIASVPTDVKKSDDDSIETVSLYFDKDWFDFDISVGDVKAHSGDDFIRMIYSSITTPRFGVSDPVIDSLVDVLQERMIGMTDVEKANALLDFVFMNTWFKTDEELFGCPEYVQYPSETLLFGKGDCEDLSLLLYTLYKKTGLDAVLIHCNNHESVGVAVDTKGESVSFRGKDYIVADPTSSLKVGGYALKDVWFVDEADDPMAIHILRLLIVIVQLIIGFCIFNEWRCSS